MLDWIFTTVSYATPSMMFDYFFILLYGAFAGIAGWAFMQGADRGPRWINPWTVGVGSYAITVVGLSCMIGL